MLAATAAVWGVATVVTGWIMGDYFSAALGTAIGVVIFTLLFSVAKDREFSGRGEFVRWMADIRRPRRQDIAYVPLVVAVGIVSRLTLGTAQDLLLPAAEGGSHAAVSGSDPALEHFVLLFFVASVAAPFFEELVFRNGLQKLLTLRVGGPVAIVVTSLVFALLHVPSYGGFSAPPATLALPMGVVFVDSVLFGWAYWRTGNIAVAMAAHGASNAIAVLAFAT